LTDTAVAVTPRSAGTSAAEVNPSLLFLALSLGFVLSCRVLLYVWMPDRTTDFDLLYQAGARLAAGENPYSIGMQRFYYPLPAVLLAVPFTAMHLWLARPIFDVLVGWSFAYALWSYRGSYALLALVSGAYLFAMANGQTTPLMVAAILVPALSFLLAVKPNSSAALWIARPSWIALVGVSLSLLLSFMVLPSWPLDWWMALPLDIKELMPPVMRPFGFLLLLGALRWRTPEGRLLLAIAFIPQNTLPYELVPLALIPANRLEMGTYVVGSWIAVVAAGGLQLSQSMAEWAATGWPVTLCAVYVPMLYLVVRRPKSGGNLRVGKDRRRARRLPDEDLKVDVTLDDHGGMLVTVTHLPTQLFVTESAPTREPAHRRAQDKLAALVAEALRTSKKSA
jgi:hypothetical protein